MQVQKSKRPPVASLAFDIGDVKHVREIKDVGVEVNTVNAIRDVRRETGQVCIAHEILDFDIFDRKLRNTSIDTLRRSVLVP
jgi:hypothetical protein